MTHDLDTIIESATNQIAERCLMVHVSFQYWTGKAADKRVASDVEVTENAATGTTRVTKSLVDDKYIKEVMRRVGRIRALVASYTVPWSASGGRIMPADKIVKFMAEFGELEAGFNEAVSRLLSDYPMLKRKAEVSLGSMYDPELYPTNAQLKAKFGVRLNITEVPIGDDFRFDIPDDLRDVLRDNLDKSIMSSVGEIRQDLVTRCMKPLAALENKLNLPEIKRMSSSIIDNVKDMADEAESLNIFDDEGIASAVKQMRAVVEGLQVDTLKDDEALRKREAKRVKQIRQAVGSNNPFADLL